MRSRDSCTELESTCVQKFKLRIQQATSTVLLLQQLVRELREWILVLGSHVRVRRRCICVEVQFFHIFAMIRLQINAHVLTT